MIGQPPFPRPTDTKEKEYNETRKDLEEKLNALKKRLDIHIGKLGEKVVHIGKSAHPVFDKDLFVEIITDLKDAEIKKDEARISRRNFFMAGVSAGLLGAFVGTTLGKALTQLREEISARKEKREPQKVGVDISQIAPGVFLGGLTGYSVYKHLKDHFKVDEKASEANQRIFSALLEKNRLIKYCQSQFIKNKNVAPDLLAEQFVNEFLEIVSKIANVEQQIMEMDNQNSK